MGNEENVGIGVGWSNQLSDGAKEAVRAAGGFCHRQPSVVTLQVQGPPSAVAGANGERLPGAPQMVRMSGFGLCQKDLCPLWSTRENACLDRVVLNTTVEVNRVRRASLSGNPCS
jgi:hypothetical protein